MTRIVEPFDELLLLTRGLCFELGARIDNLNRVTSCLMAVLKASGALRMGDFTRVLAEMERADEATATSYLIRLFDSHFPGFNAEGVSDGPE